MFGGIIGLIIPIALVVVIVRAVQGRSDLSGGAPDVSLRRFFHYLVLLGLLIIVAMGSAGLLAEILPESGTIARRGASEAARALTFTVIGGPLLIGMAFWTRRRLAADPNESESLGWAFYLTVTLLIALGVTMTIGAKVLHWALSDGDIDTTDVSHGAVWAIVWVVHWMISQRTISPLRMTAHTIAGSAAGLGVLVASVILALGAALNTLYSELFETLLLDDLEDLLLEAGSLFIVGALVWWWYWLVAGRKAERTTLWNVYVLLVGVLGGLVTALVASGILIAKGLEYFLDSGAEAAAAHFDFAPDAATALLVGTAVWIYHRVALGSGDRSEVHRAHDYLVSGAGLFAAAAGIAAGVVALIDAVTESTGTIVLSSNRDQALIAAITLLIIGVPTWWIMWRGVRRRAGLDPEIEVRSGVRRVYLFALLGIGAVGAVISLIVFVFIVIEDVLNGELGTSSIRDAEVAIGSLLALLAVAGYHWIVYQEDRALFPDGPRLKLREVVYVGADGRDMVKAIAKATGARVHVWARDDDVSGSLMPIEIVEALEGLDEERVLVIQKARGAFEIIPIRR